MHLYIPQPVNIAGDVKIELMIKRDAFKTEQLCHFWFNTLFLEKAERPHYAFSSGESLPETYMTLSLSKLEIDGAHKDKSDKTFDKSFQIDLDFVPNVTAIAKPLSIIPPSTLAVDALQTPFELPMVTPAEVSPLKQFVDNHDEDEDTDGEDG